MSVLFRTTLRQNRPEKYENVIEEVALYIFTEAKEGQIIQHNISVVWVQYTTVIHTLFSHLKSGEFGGLMNL